jgi:hypothetical protein
MQVRSVKVKAYPLVMEVRMSLLEQTPGLLDALRGELTPKFLATRSSDGVPNAVPCVSILPAVV